MANTGWLGIKDDKLTKDLEEYLTHDDRTRTLNLTIHVDGGVAHIEGEVQSEEERQNLRQILRQFAGLYAVWDLITLSGEKLKVADLGCGGKKQVDWAIGVDQFPAPGVDIIANLEQKLPFEDSTFDHVFTVNILEHIYNLLGLMKELHRVVRPTGVLHVIVPHWKNVIAVADPTHVRYMDIQSFKYFCEPHPEVAVWNPLMVSASLDTVFADLQPVKDTIDPDQKQLARWFY